MSALSGLAALEALTFDFVFPEISIPSFDFPDITFPDDYFDKVECGEGEAASPPPPDDDDDGDDQQESKETSPNQMNEQIKKGQAPKEVKRVDNPDPQFSEPHVHFKDGTSITKSGKIHDASHGAPKLTRAILDWLHKNGWCMNIN